MVFAFISPGPTELIIIGAIVLLLFGNRLPGVMRSLGRGVVEFKRGISGVDDDQQSPPQDNPPRSDSHNGGQGHDASQGSPTGSSATGEK